MGPWVRALLSSCLSWLLPSAGRLFTPTPAAEPPGAPHHTDDCLGASGFPACVSNLLGSSALGPWPPPHR